MKKKEPTFMSLFDRIQEDLKQAMKAREKEKVGVFRMMVSEIKRLAIDEGKRDEITDELVVGALSRSAKRRKESIEQYRAAGREDLARKEEQELEIVACYLPAPLTDEEIEYIIYRLRTIYGDPRATTIVSKLHDLLRARREKRL